MKMTEYLVKQDIVLIRELLNLSQEQFGEKLGVSAITVARWETEKVVISDNNLEKIYSYAYKNQIYINEIKSQLYNEDINDDEYKVIFHGAKKSINGEIDISYSRVNNDFGQGFYCGESYEQSSLFVSGFNGSSVYVICFDKQNLSKIKYKVDQEWLLTIAYFRGKLKNYEHSKVITSLIEKLKGIDYIIAPIADNKMFQIIDSFIDGEITDEQCRHCLAATNLGFQYVFKTPKALRQIKILERCYLSDIEKEANQTKRIGDNKMGESKIKIARRQYRGQGQYIDEIL